MSNRIDALETNLSFFEDTLEKLSNQLINQQQEILSLKAKIQKVNSRLDSMKPSDTNEESPPPHY